MSDRTKIEWCDYTFNPWRGCSKVSDGCKHCYAETMSKRNPGTLGVWGDQGTRVVASEAYWRKPLKWAREARKRQEQWEDAALLEGYRGPEPHRPRVFCASLADVFEDRQELVEPRMRLLALIEQTPELDWLLLTKRPEDVHRLLAECWDLTGIGIGWTPRLPGNVWLGTSVACQEDADRNIPALLNVPAAVRFVSAEPLVGPVDFSRWLDGSRGTDTRQHTWLQWIIVGGESGPKARPCNVEWIRSAVHQGREAGVPVFVKQLGANVRWSGVSHPGGHFPGGLRMDDLHCEFLVHLRDPKGGDPAEWPEDLRVREFPEVSR